MSYDEDSGRATISTPMIEINKDFGTDYTINASFTHDSVTGRVPHIMIAQVVHLQKS